MICTPFLFWFHQVSTTNNLLDDSLIDSMSDINLIQSYKQFGNNYLVSLTHNKGNNNNKISHQIFPNKEGKYYEWRMDMETLTNFEERDYMEALSYIGLLPE